MGEGVRVRVSWCLGEGVGVRVRVQGSNESALIQVEIELTGQSGTCRIGRANETMSTWTSLEPIQMSHIPC